MKLGFTVTLVSNTRVKSSNHRLTIRLSTNIAKINVERCVTIAFAQKSEMKSKSHGRGFPDCASAVEPQSFFRAILLFLIGIGTVLKVMSEVAAELIPAILQGSKLLCRSEIDGPFGLANGSPPHGTASTNSRIDGGRRVPNAGCIAGNVRPEIAYSKAAAQTATGGRAACFESPALPPTRSLGFQKLSRLQ
jgi:hypothetical protein